MKSLYLEKEISTYKVDTLPKELLLEAKQKVLPTDKLHMMRCLESQVHTLRMTMNINRVQISDTCAAEFKAKTPYYYSTFEAEIEKTETRYVDNESCY
jgi:carbamoyl-phosphate synthase large subunit